MSLFTLYSAQMGFVLFISWLGLIV
jgi:hypothetical protein